MSWLAGAWWVPVALLSPEPGGSGSVVDISQSFLQSPVTREDRVGVPVSLPVPICSPTASLYLHPHSG